MIALILIAGLGVGGGFETPGAEPAATATAKALARFESSETHMGSAFHVILYSTAEATARDAFRAAFRRIGELDTILSDYRPESELSRLSDRAGGPAVVVGDDLFRILDRSKQLWKLSGGAFDVTTAPVGRLWRRARRDRRLPDPDLLRKALGLVGSDRLIVDPDRRTARLVTPGMRLDPGGIAKGYAAQAALDVLRECGIRRALVAGAGDVVAGDAPPDAPGWSVEIAPLGDPASSPDRTILLENAAVSTSGDAERFVVIDGARYSHIVDPRTGLGVVDRAGATVIAPDGATADALATAVFVLGPDKGIRMIESIPGAAACYVRKSEAGIETFTSSRFPRGDVRKFSGSRDDARGSD